MSGTNPRRLAASLRQLGGRQNRSESHLPNISTGPEQLEGEQTVRFGIFACSFVLITAFQRSQTPLPQPKRGIKDKFKELFASKSKRTSRTHSPALPAENIHPTEVCTDCVFEVSPITNLTGPTSLRTRSLPSLSSLLRIKSRRMPPTRKPRPTKSAPQILQPWKQLAKMQVEPLLR
jgi:hypothetical protein